MQRSALSIVLRFMPWLLAALALSGCATSTAPGAVGITRSQLMIVPSAAVAARAAEGYARISSDASQAGRLNTDTALTARVRGVGRQLIAVAGSFRPDAAGWPWEINVIQSAEINAFCMPGGKIAVYSGLVERLQLTDAEIAAVMGHEISHALREHSREKISQQTLSQAVVTAIANTGQRNAGAHGALAALGSKLFLQLPFSREMELIAAEPWVDAQVVDRRILPEICKIDVSRRELTVLNVFANRKQRSDFIINELQRRGVIGCDVFIAVAFFTEAEVVNLLLDKGCKIRMVVRLGFPTNPAALEAIRRHENISLRFFSAQSFHPKLYIFGNDVALVGSANLTHTAITSNQEVMLGISGDEERFPELAGVFQNYWDDAEVLTGEKLRIYAQAYKKYEAHENAADKLAREVADALGNTAPANIDRGERNRSKQSLFLDNYRKAYQEAVSAFGIVRRAYEAAGYRKASEADIPLRLEIDSFISFVRVTCSAFSVQSFL